MLHRLDTTELDGSDAGFASDPLGIRTALWEEPMSPRFIIGAGLVLGAFVAIAVVSYFSNRELYMTVDEFVSDPMLSSVAVAADSQTGASDPERRQRLQVRGTVDYSSVERPQEGLELRFDLTGDTDGRLSVVYHGLVPDTFDRAETVTVAGTVGSDGVFVADDLLVQCPSKYEAVPPGAEATDL